MKLKDQLSSLELSRILKALGVKQNAFISWELNRSGHSELVGISDAGSMPKYPTKEYISAFAVAELYKILSELNPHACFMDGIIPEELANYIAEEIINELKSKKIKEGAVKP